MGEIKYKKNKFYFLPNVQEELDDLNGSKAFSWFVFKGEKYPKTKNKYKLREGDIFKLARIFFIVRAIHIKKKNNAQNDTNCLISYHSKINQSLVMNDNCENNKGIQLIDNSSESSNTDICEDSNESDEDGYKDKNNDKIFEIKNKTTKKTKSKNSKNKKKIKKDDKAIIKELKSANSIKCESKNNDNNYLKTNESKQSEKQKICRICYIGEIDNNSNPLIRPCKCSGSMKYIHYKCLLHWLKTKIEIDKTEYIENDYFSLYSSENIQCELCKQNFPHFIKHDNKLFNLTELEQNYDSDLKAENKNNNNKDQKSGNINSDDNYIVLDSMSPDKDITPYRYLVKFRNNLLKIGRGLDMNLILNDLSISRNHCQLEINSNGELFLKDNNSKFGTLILVQAKSIEILKGQMLTIQAGRTYFNINYKTNFSLLGCCNPEEIDSKTSYEKINYKSIKLEKNCVILTESDSDGESEENKDKDKKNNDEAKNEENEYENNIKKMNNKKIKLMRLSKKDKKANKPNETNPKSVNEDRQINNNIFEDERYVTEQKKSRSKSKNKKNNLSKSIDDKDDNKKEDEKEVKNNGNEIDNKKDEND